MAPEIILTKEIRLFGLPEDTLRQRLADLLDSPVPAAALSVYEGDACLRLTAAAPNEQQALAQLEQAARTVADRLDAYVYSYDGGTLAARVVALLAEHGLTVATAESCTGGLVSAALTDVPGASRVFGTGVVSYSLDCKEKLLEVSSDTLAAEGAVSATTAGQMARGVRRTAGAALGVAVTGEAGPQPAEAHPVGTVFIALADAKRIWVEELHLEGPDRAAIRRQAAGHLLALLWRYLRAYPTVMAGGETHQVTQQRQIPRTQGEAHPRLLARLFPWRGDPPRRILVKSGIWLAVLALLVSGVLASYRYLLEPDRNRQLQNSLGDLYWGDSADLTDGAGVSSGHYPEGMTAQFRGLYDMNEDIGGWIHIPDTGIDYPVMTYADEYYRNHSFTRQYSIYGQPYFGEDHTLSSTAVNRTLVVYGRNTGDSQMFSELMNYRRVAYVQEHPVIELNTLYAGGMWEIFAVLVVDERHPEEFDYAAAEWADDEAFLSYVEELQERSLFHADCTVTAEDTLLLLSANAQDEYGFSGARLVIAARRMTGTESGITYRVNYQAKMPAALSHDRRTTTTKTAVTTTTTTTAPTTATTATTTITLAEDTTTTSAVAADSTTLSATTATDANTVPSASSEPVNATTGSVTQTDPISTTTVAAGEAEDPALPQEDTTEQTEMQNHDNTGN